MSVRDWYISTLEKRAADETNDSAESAHQELESNQGEQTSDLKGLFTKADGSGKADSKLCKACFPQARKADDTTSSSTLLKVAMNRAFFDGLRGTGFMKLADPEYIRTAFQGFEDEIGKIAATVSFLPSALEGAEKYLAKATKGWASPASKAAPRASGSVVQSLPKPGPGKFQSLVHGNTGSINFR